MGPEGRHVRGLVEEPEPLPLVAGLSEGLVLLASTGTEGLLVDDGGTIYPTAGLDRFLARSADTNPERVHAAGAILSSSSTYTLWRRTPEL